MDAQAAWGDCRLGSGLKALSSPVQRSGVYVFLIAFTCVFYLSNAPILLSHLDLGWHLVAGDIIREQGQVPVHDSLSFTSEGRQWYNLSWLWDVIASVIFQTTGFGGIVAFVIASGAIIVGYLASVCLSNGASAIAVCISVLAAAMLYPAFAAAPNIYLAASPNTATMLFAVMFFAECLKRTRWFLLPLAMILWVNLHGGFVLGFLILGVFGGVALLKRDWAGVRIYFLAGLGCVLAIFVNPLGWHIYDGVMATLGHFVQIYITEWWSYYRSFAMPGSLPGLLYIFLFVALELRHPKGAGPIEARLLSWLFLLLGLYQSRYMSFFFLFASVPLALHLDRLMPERLQRLDVQKALLAGGVACVCTLPLTYMQVRADVGIPHMLSEQDARYLQTQLPHARLLNNWNVGGELIFYTKGTVPVFVDGRAATAFPDGLLRDYFPLTVWQVDEAAWDKVIDKYRIDTVLWVKAHDPLRRFLVDKRGWKVAYDGAYESIYVKP